MAVKSITWEKSSTLESIASFEDSRSSWSLVKLAYRLIRPISLIILIMCFLVFTGYAFDSQAIYRPIPDFPATNPLTTMCISLIALALFYSNQVRLRLLNLAFLGCCTLLVLLRLAEEIYSISLTPSLTPFSSQVEQQRGQGLSNKMSINTALTLLLLNIALALKFIYKPLLSQLVNSVALFLPMMAIVGYSFGLLVFYDHISLTTTIMLLLLVAGTFAATAHRALVKSLLSPYLGGRLARIQAVFAHLVPISIGFIVYEIDSLEARPE